MNKLEALLRFVGLLDSRDDYMKSLGGVGKVRVVDGAIEQDVNEIYRSDSYKEAQRVADRVVEGHA